MTSVVLVIMVSQIATIEKTMTMNYACCPSLGGKNIEKKHQDDELQFGLG